MVRRCKEDAEQTRLNILDAARRVFVDRGVSRTTLSNVAKAAGVTRGAVYWYFKNKMDLFFAMREQISLPLVDEVESVFGPRPNGDPLAEIEQFLLSVLRVVERDATARATFEIMTFKCEYVDELEPALAMQNECGEILVRKLKKIYERARSAGVLDAATKPALAALGTHVFLVGLIRLWLLDHATTRRQAVQLISIHIAAHRRRD